MINYLINLGIKPTMPSAEKGMMQLHNKLLLTVCLIAFLRLLKDLFDFSLPGIVITSCILGLNAFNLYLTYRDKFHVARYLNISGFLPIVIALKIIYGSAIGVDFVVMTAMAMVLFFHRNKIERRVIFLSYGVSFALACWWVAVHGVLIVDSAITGEFYYYLFVGGMMVILMVLNAFVKERDTYQLHTDKLLEELKNNDQALQDQKHKLEKVNSDLEKFVYMASHDLKSPLRNIESFIGLIDRKTRKMEDKDLNQYMDFVKKGAYNMQNLITGILDYSKIVQPKNEWSHLGDILQEVQHNLQNVIKEKGAVVEIEKLPKIYADHAQMVMLFQNLLKNGIKYNDQKEPRINIRCVYNSTTFQVQVIDNGIGISEEYHQRIFDMFSRLHTSGEYAGTGIGLASCKRIMEKTEGEITLASTPGQGSTFVLEWPLTKVIKPELVAEMEF